MLSLCASSLSTARIDVVQWIRCVKLKFEIREHLLADRSSETSVVKSFRSVALMSELAQQVATKKLKAHQSDKKYRASLGGFPLKVSLFSASQKLICHTLTCSEVNTEAV